MISPKTILTIRQMIEATRPHVSAVWLSTFVNRVVARVTPRSVETESRPALTVSLSRRMVEMVRE